MPYVERDENKFIIGRYRWPQYEGQEFVSDEEAEAQLKPKSYIELRVAEYPRLDEQLDMLYHLGYDGWKAEIQKIKDKYPKPV